MQDNGMKIYGLKLNKKEAQICYFIYLIFIFNYL